MNDLFPRLDFNIDLVARQVLMSAYLYYHRNESVLSDIENDNNVRLLIKNRTYIPERYRELLDIDNNSITTFKCKYTRLIEGGAIAWLKHVTGKEIKPLGYGYFYKKSP